MRKLSFSLMLALVGLLPANAQYSFTIDGGFSGDCARVSGVRELNQQLKAIKGEVISGFPDPTSCEQARAIVNGIKAQAEMITYDARTGKTIDRKKYNCHFSLSASPCTGRPLSGGTIGTPNIKGVSEGTSFYSVNGAEEIQNWSEDEAMRRMGLDANRTTEQEQYAPIADSKYKSAIIEENGKMYFRSLNIDEHGGMLTSSTDLMMPKIIPADEKAIESYLSLVDWDSAPRFPLAHADDYIKWIKQQYKEVTGIDIDDIIGKFNRTNEDGEALRNYREFEARLVNEAKAKIDNILAPYENSKEKKEVDMALLACDSYVKGEADFLQHTDYKRVDLSSIDIPDNLRALANKLTSCNLTFSETGFNAILYYNEKTNEYTIAFEGSAFPNISKSSQESFASKIAPSIDFDMTTNEYVVNALGFEVKIPKDLWNDWGENNALQAVGRVASQYAMAKEIGDLINSVPELKDIAINFTGHSLGGGIASVAGLTTGRPTYTFNAEGVSDKILSNFGLAEKKNSGEFDITAYHSSNDPLTTAQNWVQEKVGGLLGKENDYAAKAIGTEVNIGDVSSLKQSYISSGVGIIAAEASTIKSIFKDKSPDPLTLLVTAPYLISKGREKADEVANKTSLLWGHQMEAVSKRITDKNQVTQNIWERCNNEKRKLDVAMGNTRMRSYEYVYIITE